MLCRSDFKFCKDNEEAPVISDYNELSINSAYKLDSFPREVITSDNDPMLELHVATSPLQTLLQSSPNDSLLPPLPQLPSPIEGEVRERGEEDTMKSEEGTHSMYL